MTVLEAIILGIIQGLTEFLPVSSSGHIVLGEAILNTQSSDNLLFAVFVHLATVLSTMVVFYKDILNIIKGLLKFKWNDEAKFALNIIVSMMPVLVVGLFFKEEVEQLFDGRIAFVGGMLILTGILLLITMFATKKLKPLKPMSAFVIGIAQAIAVLPGISRSGSTIATGLLLGINKTDIARFSFLMVVPPIMGAALLDFKDYIESPEDHLQSGISLLAGFIAAFVTGLAACKWMIEIVKKGKIQYFAYYCFLVGVIAIVVGLK
jgi:undecaprenyl-diphosphatase